VNTVQGRKPGDPPITLLQLATHTSGLAREPDNTARYVTGPPEVWDKTLILALPHLHYQFQPGTRYSYSNIGYATLGAALERAAGQPYLDYLPQHIFTPLGMTHTSPILTPEVQAHLAEGYEKNGGMVSSSAASQENKDGRGYKVPNGAIYTTVGDLAKFASFLLGNGPPSVLDPNKLLYYQNQFIVPTGGLAPGGYSLGIMFIRYGKYVAEGHSGAVSGFNAALYINHKANIAVVVLVSAVGSGAINADSLALRALDVLSK
jgi:CubicO group peptidase (beta-lactamase class C family)